jgi:uncharacterized protein
LSELKIIEKKPISSGTVMLFGFPDVGLVGVIAATHLIDELGLEEVAYADSRLLPPVTVVHEGLPHSSLRIFGNDKVLLAVSEIPLAAELVYPAMDTLIEWGKSKKVKMLVALSGIPMQDRADATELKVFATVSSPELLKTVEKEGVEALMEGYIVGPQAIMLMRGAQMGLPAIALLAQCFLNFPDPEAAGEVLKGLAKVTDVKVDLAKLLEKGEEIRLKARDVMRRTQDEMSKMKKGQEYDIPVYVT